MATGKAPVLEALADINAVSLARAELDPVTLLLVRIAALVAVDAPAASYLMHIGPAVESGVTLELVQDVLVAVAPITGAPRVLSAAGNITDALGLVIAVAEAETEAEASLHRRMTAGRWPRRRGGPCDSPRPRPSWRGRGADAGALLNSMRASWPSRIG